MRRPLVQPQAPPGQSLRRLRLAGAVERRPLDSCGLRSRLLRFLVWVAIVLLGAGAACWLVRRLSGWL